MRFNLGLCSLLVQQIRIVTLTLPTMSYSSPRRNIIRAVRILTIEDGASENNPQAALSQLSYLADIVDK